MAGFIATMSVVRRGPTVATGGQRVAPGLMRQRSGAPLVDEPRASCSSRWLLRYALAPVVDASEPARRLEARPGIGLLFSAGVLTIAEADRCRPRPLVAPVEIAQ